MKKTLISLAVAIVAVGGSAAQANEKHLSVYVNSPGYHRGAPPAVYYGGHGGYGHRGYYAPSRYAPTYYAPRYDYRHRGGYWRDGRWVAPLAVGVAVGAIAANAYTPVYAAPAYVAPYPTTVNYYAPADRFAAADLNGDGYLSFYEARRYGNLHRNFVAIDFNGDGYLSRAEVDAWRHGW